MSCNIIYFKIKDSCVFDNKIGYVSVNVSSNLNDIDTFKYRKVVADQSLVDIENVIPIDKKEFEENSEENLILQCKNNHDDL